MGSNMAMGQPVMGAPAQAVMATTVPQPQQLTGHAEVPKGLVAGNTFHVTTEDGQQLSLTVPEGVEAGTTIAYNYAPRTVTPTIFGQPASSNPMMRDPMDNPMIRAMAFERQLAAEMGILDSMTETALERTDRQASEQGWLAYLLGWGLCCCCGPVGPALWCAVAGNFYCRPPAQREQLPRTRSVATVSLLTSVAMLLLFMVFAASYMDKGTGKAANCQPPLEWHHGRCYKPMPSSYR
jgi:hypothetical protein